MSWEETGREKYLYANAGVGFLSLTSLSRGGQINKNINGFEAKKYNGACKTGFSYNRFNKDKDRRK
jgi:hypothetical protein